MLVALIPNVADGLDASVAQVAAAITAYMVPFALLQLVSGTLAERLGPAAGRAGRRTSAFGVAAVACAFAPDIWSFLVARAAMGARTRSSPPSCWRRSRRSRRPDVLGRTVGTFAAAQTAGPDARADPRRAARRDLVAARLRPGRRRRDRPRIPRQTLGAAERHTGSTGARASLGSLLNRWIALLADAGGARLPRVHGHRLRPRPRRSRGVRPRLRRTRPAHRRVRHRRNPARALRGHVVDRAGRPATALARRDRAAPPASSASSSHRAPGALGLVFFGVGCASTFVWAGLNTIAVESFPENRAGATSAYSAFKFAGVAIAPLDLRSALQRRHAPAVRPRRRLLGAARRLDPPLVQALRMRRRVVVHGRVQGVFFRETTRRLAQELGVARLGAKHLGGHRRGSLRGPAGGGRATRRVRPPRTERRAVERVEVFEEDEEGLTGFAVR